MGKTPAQAARTNTPSNWKGLIEEATKYEATLLAKVTNQKTEANQGVVLEVMAN